jgi:16S rRNA (cytidine1402-2'-O)-methyltransferase
VKSRQWTATHYPLPITHHPLLVSILYLVSTPIGNLEDISARALRILQEVDLIAAEDTRHTGKLLKHFAISTPQTSYFEHNKLQKLDRILTALEHGPVALVSDAGTPAINDPGYDLVRAVLAAGHTVSPIPGPSAPLAALVASGLPTDRFLYLGYLPRKTGDRQRVTEGVATLPYTLIFLETPHRLGAALSDLFVVFGDREIAVARELTKLHEEIFRGPISAAAAHFEQNSPKGEITLVVAGALSKSEQWTAEEVQTALQAGLSRGESPSQIAKDLAAQSGWKRRKLYQILLEIQENI